MDLLFLLRCSRYICLQSVMLSQLRTKLQQGYYPPEIIEQAIEYVAGFHYIDDLRYAVDYITYHENSRSRRRIEQDLQGKGISSATIEEAWQNWRENGGEQMTEYDPGIAS